MDASSGEIHYKTALCRRLAPLTKERTSIHAIKWHPAGWCGVGTASGTIVHITIDGKFRAYKGAGKGIKALKFIDNDQTLLVGSGENQFRTWPLLPDELGI